MITFLNSVNFFVGILIINSCIEIQSRAESENSIQNDDHLPRVENKFAEQQLQILKLYNNLNCMRKEDKDLQDISNTFNPLENLNLYKNPEVVKDYFENLNKGLYLGRREPFTTAGELLRQKIQLFDVLFFIEDDWDLFYKTAAAAVTKVNTAQFAWALGSVLSTKYDNGFSQPPAHEIFPQLYTPKWIIQKANGEEGQKNLDDGNPESVLRYFRNDPTFSSFHFHWHIVFLFWWKPEKYQVIKDRKGELLLYMHSQLINRYKAERLSNNMSELKPFNLDEPIAEGDIPDTLNIDWREFPTREPNATLKNISGITVADIKTWESRIQEGIDKGFLIDSTGKHISLRDDKGVNVLGATIESSQQSVDPKYYRSLHNIIHRIVSRIVDPMSELKLPPGILSHAETGLQDPAFYKIHEYVVEFNRKLKQTFSPYSQKDLQFPDVYISSVKIAPENNRAARKSRLYPTVRHFPSAPVLKTFFEDYTYDISNGIKSCDKVNSGVNFTATVKRLNHYSFEYFIRIYSRKPGNTRGIVRIYMSPLIGHDGKSYSSEELYWNMFEMDRFPVTLKEGQNVIRRSSQNSSITIPDRAGFKELIKEAKQGMSKEGSIDKSRYTGKDTRLSTPCGFPDNLLLPKGTSEGMKFKMFVIITDTSTGDYDEESYPSLPMCGNGRGIFPDGRPMGFPFDRKIGFDLSNSLLSYENYMFTDVIVQHVN